MSSLSYYVQTLSQWIIKLAYVNFLWLVFCIAGGILFGWAPATVSLFTIMRKWQQRDNIPIFNLFIKTYRTEFIKANVSGLIIIGVTGVLINNLLLLSQQTTLLSILFLIGNGTLIIMLALFLTFFFPVYTHYTGRLKKIVKKAFLMGLAKLPISVFLLIICLAWGRVLLFFPGLMFFFSASIPVLIITFVSHQCFTKEEMIFKN